MPLHSFRGAEYENTHENLAFNNLFDILSRRWASKEEDIYLAGNFFVNGHEVDALIIKKNAIIVVEFKNYGGRLHTSENGQWEADSVVVKGGSAKNPYQQTRGNKFALLDFLESKATLRSQPNLGHISGLVLFHENVEFEESDLPPKVKSWFHISDMSRALRTVEAIVSRSINLSKADMDQIIKFLNIAPYDPDNEEVEQEAKCIDVPVYPESDRRSEKSEAPSQFYGIDLGTTYSLLAVVDEKGISPDSPNNIPVQFVKFEQQSPNTYDAAISDEKVASIIAKLGDRYYVGNQLYRLKGDRRFKYKENIFYHCKLEMGINEDPYYPHAIEDRLNMPYKVAGSIMNFMRASHLKSKEKDLYHTAITVPAGFMAGQREDTLKAAKIAKIVASEKMLIDEPTAAFLGYFNELTDIDQKRWSKKIRGANLLVIDFGGGTLDLSLLNINFDKHKGLQVGTKAISRYNDLGGQDLDNLIADQFLYPLIEEQFPEIKKIPFRELRDEILPLLSIWAEKLKIDISDSISLKAADKDARTLELDNIFVELEDLQINIADKNCLLNTVRMSASDFDIIFRKLFTDELFKFKNFDKTVTTISSALSDTIDKAQIKRTNIDYVLFAGGSSFNPLLKSYVASNLKNAHLLCSHQPDKLVAAGAAIYSFFFYKYGISLISSISSEEIGITLKGGGFHPIIKRGQVLPFSVDLTDFKLQNNFASEIVVPICINSNTYQIGELKAKLDGNYLNDCDVQVAVTMNENKILTLAIWIDNKCIERGNFENPYAIGQLDSGRLSLEKCKVELREARRITNNNAERKFLRKLVWENSGVNNHAMAVSLAEEYIEQFDENDSFIWNLLHCSNGNLGRTSAAGDALEKAIKINPNEPTFVYNKSLVIEKTSANKALKYLLAQSSTVSADLTIKIKTVLLQSRLDKLDIHDAIIIAEEYNTDPSLFSDFDKRQLLPQLFSIIKEPYTYKSVASKDIEGENYLDYKL